MSLLIDGYNLLYAASIVGPRRGTRGLESSRWALLEFVASVLTPAERATTIVVFDAAGAPPGLPAAVEHAGLRVRFARGYVDADALLEDLIVADSSPRRLTVVSSDHRVQRAARRRRATALDSELWYARMVHRRRDPPHEGAAESKASDRQRPATLTSAEVADWLDRFNLPTNETQRPGNDGRQRRRPRDLGHDTIFPPGYAEDIDDA